MYTATFSALDVTIPILQIGKQGTDKGTIYQILQNAEKSTVSDSQFWFWKLSKEKHYKKNTSFHFES